MSKNMSNESVSMHVITYSLYEIIIILLYLINEWFLYIYSCVLSPVFTNVIIYIMYIGTPQEYYES